MVVLIFVGVIVGWFGMVWVALSSLLLFIDVGWFWCGMGGVYLVHCRVFFKAFHGENIWYRFQFVLQ